MDRLVQIIVVLGLKRAQCWQLRITGYYPCGDKCFFLCKSLVSYLVEQVHHIQLTGFGYIE